MLTETFAPFLYLSIGALIGGLVAFALLATRDQSRRPDPLDPFPYGEVRLIDRIEPVASPDRKWHTDLLTPREMEIALRAVAGARTVDIARALVISPHTVETHIKNIYRKLEVSSRLELARVLTDLEQNDVGPPGNT